VAIVARLKSLPAAWLGTAARAPRTIVVAAGTAAGFVSLSLALAAPPAGAVVTEVGGANFGLQPRSEPSTLVSESTPSAEPELFANASGNPVVHGDQIFAVYWDPTDHYHGDWQSLIDTFLQKMGAASGSLASVFAVDAQYTDRSNQPAYYHYTFRGAYTDTDAYPAAGCTDPKPLEAKDRITCLSDKQVQEELSGFIAGHGLPKGMGDVYYLLTPPGVTVCLDGGTVAGHCSDFAGGKGEPSYEHSFCSYHAAISPTAPVLGDGNTILYGMIPWTAGGLGDTHLTAADESLNGVACQDGGFDPSSTPIPEKKEKQREKSAKEETEFKEKSKEEQKKQEEAEALQGPHQQEPNQAPCPTSDGGCDFGLADLITNQIAVEQQNIVTDPLLDAWQDPARNEATDECRNRFLPTIGGGSSAGEFTKAGTLFNQLLDGGSYYLNDAFSLAAWRLPYPGVECLPGVALVPQFTAPNQVNAGEIVGFDGMESDISLDAAFSYTAGGPPQANYATYLWSFGDGTPGVAGYAPGAPACSSPWLSPCAASVFHAYAYGGTYRVTLTVTDVGGDSSTGSHLVTVVGPPPPASAGPGAAGAGGGAKPAPVPRVTAVAASHSLRNALRKGLSVRYSVNERVAGRFEVLIASSLARRLGLHGAPATGLAPGTPPQVVIGQAILVTTGGGTSIAHIQFGKRTASRLGRLHGVTVLLRLVVKNASAQSATVLTSVTLSH
jgi:hypothetical protein